MWSELEQSLTLSLFLASGPRPGHFDWQVFGPRPPRPWRTARSEFNLGTKLLTFLVLVHFSYMPEKPSIYFDLLLNAWLHAHTMTREEELIRIAKKLDKMVSRNNMVRDFASTLFTSLSRVFHVLLWVFSFCCSDSFLHEGGRQCALIFSVLPLNERQTFRHGAARNAKAQQVSTPGRSLALH